MCRNSIFIKVCLCAVALMLASGCATDNEFLLKCTLIPRRSDKIPGLMPPHERTELVREKGKKGANASPREKEVLVAQLIEEYRNSPDANLRRESVNALAQIPHPNRIGCLKEALNDKDPNVRTAACIGIASKTMEIAPSQHAEIAHALRNVVVHDEDTNTRINAIKLLGGVPNPKATTIQKSERFNDINVAVLGDALSDKSIAVRYEAMKALGSYTGKDYGTDINRWVAFYRYERGELAEIPNERTFNEKVPKPQLRMIR